MINSETKITDLPLGTKFVTNEKFIRTSHSVDNIVWEKFSITPTQVMFLGYTNVFDGKVYKEDYDHETGYMDPPCFIQTKVHRVLVVQPIDNLRYRKPFYILSQRQKPGYWDSAEKSTIEKEREVRERQQKRLVDIKDVLGIE